LLTVSRPARLALKSFARTILATVLLVVLLAGAIPFTSLSASHECGMACCIGKPSHMAGSCATSLDTPQPTEATTEAPDDAEQGGVEQAEHDGHLMHMSGGAAHGASAPAGHHAPANQQSAGHSKYSARPSKPGMDSRPGALAASRAVVMMPCSAECAGAAPASSQMRRPRDAAPLTTAAGTGPPSLRVFAHAYSTPLTESAERRRLSRPRAPPFPLFNLTA
jgi:hypothetical protein